jgi:hypothetical protein
MSSKIGNPRLSSPMRCGVARAGLAAAIVAVELFLLSSQKSFSLQPLKRLWSELFKGNNYDQ